LRNLSGGSRYEASENLVARRARDDRRTIHLSFQSLQVMREDPNPILDELVTHTLKLPAVTRLQESYSAI
jgi:hypothetical protein